MEEDANDVDSCFVIEACFNEQCIEFIVDAANKVDTHNIRKLVHFNGHDTHESITRCLRQMLDRVFKLMYLQCSWRFIVCMYAVLYEMIAIAYQHALRYGYADQFIATTDTYLASKLIDEMSRIEGWIHDNGGWYMLVKRNLDSSSNKDAQIIQNFCAVLAYEF
jgi:hypothetical protein